MHLLRYFLLILTWIAPGLSFSQSDSLSDIKDVSIETKYRPKLEDAVKLSRTPSMNPPVADAISYDYKVPDVSYAVKPVYQIIDPVYLKVSKNQEVYGNFLKAGVGNYYTPYLKLHLHNHSNKYYDYGIALDHLSSNASSPEFANFSSNNIHLFGVKQKGNSKLKGTIDYSRNVLHYYAANSDLSSYTADSLNQILNSTKTKLNWCKKIGRRVDFNTRLTHSYFSSLTKSEHLAKLGFGFTGNTNQGRWMLPVKVLYAVANRPLSNPYNRTVFSANPGYQFRFEKYRISIGVLGGYFVDSSSASSEFFVAPDLNAYFFVVPKRMKAFLSISGNYKPRTYADLFDKNPFIGDLVNLKNEYTPVDLQTGITGQINGKLDYGLSIQYKSVQNFALFLMDSTALSRFEVVYDDVNIFTFHTEVGANINQIVRIGGELNWFNYNMSEQKSWNLPNYDFALKMNAKVKEKIYVNLKFYGMGARLANNVESGGNEITLDPFYDLNVSVDYRYKENISFFVNVNNITGGRYQRWYQYPVYGLNAVVGVTATL